MCVTTKYYISTLEDPRYHYCIFCPPAYTGEPYTKSGDNLDQNVYLKYLKLPTTDNL